MPTGQIWGEDKVPASHRVGVQPRGAPQQGWGLSGGGLSSPPAALTLKWPVLAKIWYLPWVVIREP